MAFIQGRSDIRIESAIEQIEDSQHLEVRALEQHVARDVAQRLYFPMVAHVACPNEPVGTLPGHSTSPNCFVRASACDADTIAQQKQLSIHSMYFGSYVGASSVHDEPGGIDCLPFGGKVGCRPSD